MCGKPEAAGAALMKCSRCHSAVYCSVDCQRADWKAHKLDCKRLGVAYAMQRTMAQAGTVRSARVHSGR